MDIPKNGYEQAAISLAPIKTDMTLDEFCQSDLEGYEYVKGELIPMPAASAEHGIVSARVFLHLGLYVRENQLGEVVTPDTGFQVGERVLKPDIAFLSTAHLPEDLSKAFPVPPDLAIEVVSPSDAFRRVIEKAFAYIEAGTQIVWVIEPGSKTVTVYRSETDIKLLTREDTLDGEDVVEGFSCQVAQLFE
jgi:Uma2 family endonuclease